MNMIYIYINIYIRNMYILYFYTETVLYLLSPTIRKGHKTGVSHGLEGNALV